MTHAFGWRPELPARDLLFGDARYVRTLAELPDEVDNSGLAHRPENQGRQSSCVGHATGTVFEVCRAKDWGGGDPANAFQASRAFIYYEARRRQGWEHEDGGCYIRDAMDVCVEQGVPIEQSFPYDEHVYDREPPPEVYHQAEHFQVTRRLKLRNTRLVELLTCLADGYAFEGGLTLYESIESVAVALTGRIPLPGWRESVIGGHALAFLGYSRRTEMFKGQNSWSEQWGDNGFFYVPFDYVTDGQLAADFHTIQRIEEPAP
jgi:C1A family cysteine protease